MASVLLQQLQRLVDSPTKKFTAAWVVILLLLGLKATLNSGVPKGPASPVGKKKNERRVNVDKEFLAKLKRLLGICLPSIWRKETVYFIALSIALVLRTFLSIKIADINGIIVQSIVNKNFPEFVKKILTLVAFALPSSTINSFLDYLQKKLALCFRESMTKHLHSTYMSGMLYYRITALDTRIQNPDQRLTTDIEKWSTALSTFYSNFTKPILDIILFSRKLAALIGWEGPALTILYYFSAGALIKLISPAFSKMYAGEMRLEGQYR